MEYKVKKNNNATAELKMTFSTNDIENGFKKAYERARTKIKINGFRQGKAPVEMVEKILGDSVTEDAVNIILQDGFNQIIGSIEPAPIRFPQFKVDEFNRKKTLIVSATYFTPSEVVLNKYKKMKIEERKIKITDEDIFEDLKVIQERMMKTQLKEENELSEKNDIIEFEYSFEPNHNKEKFPLKAKYRIGANENSAEFDLHLTGVKAGQKLEFSINPKAANDENQSPDSIAVKYSIDVLGVYKTLIPELNDELAVEWDGTPTLAELKEKLKKELEGMMKKDLKFKSITELTDKIIDESKFT
ncbi:MAG: trigger factor, partial [Leptospiraceae bacterium]|nr:trigger factor [Leptospiraceae bacterium]